MMASSAHDPTGVDAIILGCVHGKHPGPARAKDLYDSAMFAKRRRYAEMSGKPWVIFSANHGILDPDDVVDWYDVAMSKLPVAVRHAKGLQAASQLERRFGPLDGKTFEIHAGASYVKALTGPLDAKGGRLVNRLEHLGFGYQLQWYDDHASGGALRQPPADDRRARETPMPPRVSSQTNDRLNSGILSLEPWMHGPFELLGAGERHLREGSDTDRRMAMVHFDNAIEVSIQAFGNLHPKNRRGIVMPREQTEKAEARNFYSKIEFLEWFITSNHLDFPVAFPRILWYHDLRNRLYHGGNGVVPELANVKGVREAALATFHVLFDVDPRPLLHQGPGGSGGEAGGVAPKSDWTPIQRGWDSAPQPAAVEMSPVIARDKTPIPIAGRARKGMEVPPGRVQGIWRDAYLVTSDYPRGMYGNKGRRGGEGVGCGCRESLPRLYAPDPTTPDELEAARYRFVGRIPADFAGTPPEGEICGKCNRAILTSPGVSDRATFRSTPRDSRLVTEFLGRRLPDGLDRRAHVPRSLRAASASEAERGVVVAYKVRNFTVYRAVVGRLVGNERFRMESDDGTFEIPAIEFDDAFAAIAHTRSYREGPPSAPGSAYYVVGTPPTGASRFRVPE